MSLNKKKSNFTAQTSVSDSDFVDIFRSGINRKVSFADFKLSLGITGTLQSIGSPTATPVMTQSGTVFSFRAIESGPGIISQLSPLDGIQLSSNIFQSTGGFSIIEDLSAAQLKYRTLKVISPLQLAVDGDSLSFSISDSPLAQTNTVIVSDISDFPDPLVGVITLEDNTNYVIVQPITTSNRFVLGENNAITANNIFTPVFTYTGVDTMFTGVDKSLTMSFMSLDCPNGGTVFDTSSPVVNNSRIIINSVSILSCKKIGVFDDLRVLDVIDSGAFDTEQGFEIKGSTNWVVVSLNRMSIVSTSPTLVGIDFGTSVHSKISLDGLIVLGVSGAIAIKGAASSANLLAGRLGTVTGSDIAPGVTELSGITSKDIRWQFQQNTGIPNTRPDGLIDIVDNALATNITASSTDGTNAVKMAGVWGLEGSSHFTIDTTGRITYIGETEFTAPIDVTVNVLMASGGTKNVSAYLVITGTLERATEGKGTPTSALGDSCICHWQHTFQTNDWVEVWLENQSDAENIVGVSGVLRVN
jgi:hypothetical protein